MNMLSEIEKQTFCPGAIIRNSLNKKKRSNCVGKVCMTGMAPCHTPPVFAIQRALRRSATRGQHNQKFKMTFCLLRTRKWVFFPHPLFLPPLTNSLIFITNGVWAWLSSHTDRFLFILSEKWTKGNTKQMNGQKYE